MPTRHQSTVVGVFHDRAHADQAIAELRRAGFREDQIGVVTQAPEGALPGDAPAEGSHWEEGALSGALTGIGLGGLIGLGVLAGVIPVIGPAIAAGTLGVILTNAAGGAALAGLAGALIGAGVPEDEAHYYEGELKAGRTIVTIKADKKAQADEADTVLRRNGAYNMHTAGAVEGAADVASASTTQAGRAVSSRSGSAVGSAVGTPVGGAVSSAAGGQKIEVREEELHATKRPVEAGEVRVRKEVHTEHRTIDVPVEREEVVIERRPASGRASTSDIREGEEIRIPVMEEEVTVEKRAVVKEEVNVGKRVVRETEHVGGTVRKEEVKVVSEGDVEVHGSGSDKTTRKSTKH